MSSPIYRTRRWRVTSRRVLLRDGHECQIRLPGCLGKATTADHIVELADGGAPFALSNLQAACRPCNTAKRNGRVAARGRNEVRPW